MIMGMCIGCSPYNAEQSVITQAIAVLRRFGTDAHIYLPGVGMLNGLQAGNYLDSAGTTQGTVDQPVGLVLDAAGSLGVELIADPSFDNPAYWTVSGATVSGGVATVVSVGGEFAAVSRPITTAVGKTYQVTVNIESITGAGTVVVNFNAQTAATQIPKLGESSYIFVSDRINNEVAIKRGSGASTTVAMSLSVREVTGIAASQPTTASKPILRRGALNLLTYSGDFSNAAWVKTSSSFASEKLTETAVSSFHFQRQSTTLAAGVYTYAIKAKKAERDFVFLSAAGGASRVIFDLSSGSVTFSDGGAAGTISLHPDGDYICCLSVTVAANQPLDIAVNNSATVISSYSGVSNSGIFLRASGAFQGTYTAAQIQALGGIPLTTTAPASTALGSQYWQFDGLNDSLSLGGPLFQMADDHCVVAGFNGTSFANSPDVFSHASTANNNALIKLGAASNNYPSATWRDDSGALVSLDYSGYGDIRTRTVITALRKLGADRTFWVDGVQVSSSSTAIGAATINTAAIGARPLVTPGAYLNGAIYPAVAIKGSLSDPDLLLIKKFVGLMSGVTI